MKRIVFIGFILLFLTFSQGTANANVLGDLWDVVKDSWEFIEDLGEDIVNDLVLRPTF
jgi:hypothetical protein